MEPIIKVNASLKRPPLQNGSPRKIAFYNFLTLPNGGYEYSGGCLTIDKEKLFFKANYLNFHRENEIIKVKDILSVSKRNYLGKFSNMITVATKNNEYVFAVSDRNKIIGIINTLISNK